MIIKSPSDSGVIVDPLIMIILTVVVFAGSTDARELLDGAAVGLSIGSVVGCDGVIVGNEYGCCV